MRLPVKTGFTPGRRIGFDRAAQRCTEQPYVQLWAQPVHRWLLAQAYHHYDMIVYRLPGFTRLERWLQHRHRDDPDYLPLSARQDLRCHDLGERGLRVLATLEVDAETYAELAGRVPV